MKALLLVLAISATTLLAGDPPAQPNFVFLFSDDQRFDTIHALGNREIRTPNLDRLARQGFSFTHTFCMGSMVGAVCVPSRAMLMTGRTLFRATTTPLSGSLPPRAPLWPQVLRENGYISAGIGKWHNDKAACARAFSTGGPFFFGGMNDHRQMPVHSYDSTGAFPKARQRVEKTFSTELFADAAVRFLETKPAQPFSLYVAFTAPHDPRTPPASYARLYKPEKTPLPASFLPQHPFDNGELKVRDEQLLPWPRTPEAVHGEIASYYAMISHLDAQIGRILDSLRKHDLDKNTFVIFAGDNGLAIGRHGLLGKQNLYDHSVRVPLILRGPGIPRNKRSDALVYLFDLFPTICELAGVPLPATVEGKSLVGIMTGREPKVRDSVFGAYRQVQRMVRDDRWKLIQYPRLGREQLFDLKADPDELHDLARDAGQAPIVEKLRAELARWQKQTGDPLARNPGPNRPGAPAPASP